MNSIFNPDNPFINFLTKVSNLILLNLIFLLSCIPVITIGAALSALYSVTLKTARQEDPYIWRTYWKAFRENFKQSTLIWLIFIPVIAVIIVDFIFLRAQKGSIFTVLQIALWGVSLFLFSIFIYIFPIVSHFVCTTKQAFKNAFLMSIAHLPGTALLLLMYTLIGHLCFRSVKSFAFVFLVADICGISVTALCASLIFDRIFKIYEPETRDDNR